MYHSGNMYLGNVHSGKRCSADPAPNMMQERLRRDGARAPKQKQKQKKWDTKQTIKKCLMTSLQDFALVCKPM